MQRAVETWDWDRVRARAGVGADGAFNAGGMNFGGSLRWRTLAGADSAVDPGELENLVVRIAGTLERMGVERGDRVVGLLGRRPEAFATAIATWRLGGVYVPLFTSFGTEAIQVRMEDSTPVAAVTDGSNRDALGRAQTGASDLNVLVVDAGGAAGDAALDGAGSSTALADTNAEEPATIVYTSGTTSRPKGCVMPHRALLNLWPYVESCLRLTPRDVFFSTADPGWSFGLLTTGLAPISLGYSRCLYEPGFNAAEWWRVIDEWGVTHLASAPTGLRQLAAADEAERNSSLALRSVTTAGEPLTADVVTWFKDQLGVDVCNSYGLTELGMLTANVRDPDNDAGALSLGYPLPGFEIRVLDENGVAVAPGNVGLLAVRNDRQLLSTTYWQRDAEWQSRLQGDWWVTEDLVRADDDGRLWFVDRRDDVIVSAGYNVSPSEVERVLLDHPVVDDAACIGEPDPRKGQVIVAHVVLRTAPTSDLLSELRQMVGEGLGWHAAPRRLEVTKQLPRTESGKLRRRDLRRQ